jgi:hypothetical protein
MNKKILMITIAALIIGGGGGFFGGMKYQQNKKPTNLFANRGSQNGQGPASFRGGNTNSGSMAVGEIISKDDKSITVKTQNGGSKIIFFSSSTTIAKMAEGQVADLNVGETVTATGTSNQDGSITAQSIQIRPEINLPPPVENKQ